MSIPFEDSWYIPKIRWQNVQVLTQELLPQKELFQEKFCPLFCPHILSTRKKKICILVVCKYTYTHTHIYTYKYTKINNEISAINVKVHKL